MTKVLHKALLGGTCFGGPMDGEHLRHEYWEYICPLPGRSYFYDSPAGVEPTLPVVRYAWQQVRHGRHTWGCWVADDYRADRITEDMNFLLGVLVLLGYERWDGDPLAPADRALPPT